VAAGDDDLFGAVDSRLSSWCGGGLLDWSRGSTSGLNLDLAVVDLVNHGGSHGGASRKGSDGE